MSLPGYNGPSRVASGRPGDPETASMQSLTRSAPPPRYGSAAQLATYAGLGVKTIRRLVDGGKVRGLKVGRRLLIRYEDLDRLRTKGGEACPRLSKRPQPGGRSIPEAGRS